MSPHPVVETIEALGCSIVLRRVEGPEARELFFRCQPPAAVADAGGQAEAIYRAILGVLEAEGGADAALYAGHPRTASSYSLTLQLGRENGVPLMFTLAQTSYWTAKHLGNTGLQAIKERGRVQVGKVADLTLFNPKTVKANATYKSGENGLAQTGIPYVIVNGTIVVKESNVLPVKPGQPIRFPVEA